MREHRRTAARRSGRRPDLFGFGIALREARAAALFALAPHQPVFFALRLTLFAFLFFVDGLGDFEFGDFCQLCHRLVEFTAVVVVFALLGDFGNFDDRRTRRTAIATPAATTPTSALTALRALGSHRSRERFAALDGRGLRFRFFLVFRVAAAAVRARAGRRTRATSSATPTSPSAAPNSVRLHGFVVRSALAQIEDRQLFEATARGRCPGTALDRRRLRIGGRLGRLGHPRRRGSPSPRRDERRRFDGLDSRDALEAIAAIHRRTRRRECRHPS